MLISDWSSDVCSSDLGGGYAPSSNGKTTDLRPHVVAIDYGSKRNIFRNLVKAAAKVSVVPATASFEQIIALEPDGFFLSNGPGDPAANADYAVPVNRKLLETGHHLFARCPGHQWLGLALGAATARLFQRPRRANHRDTALIAVRDRVPT